MRMRALTLPQQHRLLARGYEASEYGRHPATDEVVRLSVGDRIDGEAVFGVLRIGANSLRMVTYVPHARWRP